MPDTNYHDRKLVACDYFGRPVDLAAIKAEKEIRHFGVFDTRKALSDTSGPLVSNHSTRSARSPPVRLQTQSLSGWTFRTRSLADKAAKVDHHYKVLETKKPLNKGDHAN
jgi:hypothetical protein